MYHSKPVQGFTFCLFELNLEARNPHCSILPLRLRTHFGKEKRPAGVDPNGLSQIWLPAVDTLRNLFYAPTLDMKITINRLEQVSIIDSIFGV